MGRARYLKVNPDRNNGVGHQRWLYCVFCGALNDIERNSTGDGVGNMYQATSTYGGDPLKYLPLNEANIHLSDDDVQVLCKADYGLSANDETPAVAMSQANRKHPPVLSTAVSGCWHCGSKAYNGSVRSTRHA